MTNDQVTLLASLLTLGGIMITAAISVVQHHWQENERKETARKLEHDRKMDAQQLESDRVLLAQALEHQRQETLDATEAALEKRAAEIRKSLDEQAEIIRKRQESLATKMDQAALERARLAASVVGLHADLESNTALTKAAVDNAAEAYKEANHIGLKLEGMADATMLESRTEQRSIRDTGEDSNKRIRDVQEAVIQTDQNVSDNQKRIADLETDSPSV